MPEPAAERSLLQVALGCLCPRCGEGKLYTGILTVTPVCAVCGLDLSKQDAGDGASVFVILILGAVIVLLGVIVDHLFEPPLWVHAILWTPITIIGAILMLRPLKAGLIAQEYRMHSLGGMADEE